ncbi:MAG: hypothetical protein PVI75_08235 [Gammaproteobacteria bacterium]|jgi:hypothetical protein
MYEESKTPIYTPEEKRPLLITLSCVFGVAIILVTLYLIFIDPSTNVHAFITHGFWRPIILAITNLAALAAFIGIWQMKRWGLILMIAMYIISIIYNFMMNIGNYWGYIPGAIIIIICLFYFKKMR